jgi:hypothetical protein
MTRLIYTLIVSTLILGHCFASDSQSGQLPASHFAFEESVRLFPTPKVPGDGACWLSLVPMKGVKGFPFDYALFFSTDHERTGGIWMYVCKGIPTDPKGWKSYDQAVADGDFDHIAKKPEKNPIFVDKTEGRSTETPTANVIDGVVHLTYHNLGAGRSQSTLLCTSSDGVNFARINGKKSSVILDYKGGPGNGHTGYFRWRVNPFSGVDAKYVGYSLHGGGDRYYMAQWVSNDAKQWKRLKVFKSLEGAPEDGLIMSWHGLCTDSIRKIAPNEYVVVGSLSARVSGNKSRRQKALNRAKAEGKPTPGRFEIFLGADGATLTRKPRRIAGPETCVEVDGVWYWISIGPKYTMGKTGSFSKNAVKTPKLDKKDQTRHIWTK